MNKNSLNINKKTDFISLTDLSEEELWQILLYAKKIKEELKETGKNTPVLQNKTLAMIFEMPSLRTRLSFEVGMTQLGGHAIYLAPSDIGIKGKIWERESPEDIAQVSSSIVDVIMAKTYSHATVEKLAASSKVPVINGLSDLEHPCQIVADLMTIWEKKGKLKGLTIGYVGDGENNVTHSLVLAAAILGMHFKCASPPGFWIKDEVIKKAMDISKKTHATILQTTDPKDAVENADVVITDTWTSMGDEAEKTKRVHIFKSYQVNKELMKYAKKDALFMHCLPAYRNYEVTSDVIDGSQSVVLLEAENRLHAQKGLLCYLLNCSK